MQNYNFSGHNLRTKLLALFFPTRCIFCKSLTDGVFICPKCQGTVPWNLDDNREKKGEFFTQCVAPLRYRGDVITSFHRYKFSGYQSYAKQYAVLMAQCITDRLEMSPDFITWAPISPSRRRRRGYDQSQLLARELGRILQCPVRSTLIKSRHTPAQSALVHPHERRANALGAYQLNSKISVAGCRILLIDDIITSGSTLSECARILQTHGALEISCAVFARA